MRWFHELTGGLSLLAFAIGGVLICVGAVRAGRRALALAAVLLVAGPLAEAGLSTLGGLEVSHGHGMSIIEVAAAVLAAAVLLAGILAWRRAGGRNGDTTSLKTRREE